MNNLRFYLQDYKSGQFHDPGKGNRTSGHRQRDSLLTEIGVDRITAFFCVHLSGHEPQFLQGEVDDLGKPARLVIGEETRPQRIIYDGQ